MVVPASVPASAQRQVTEAEVGVAVDTYLQEASTLRTRSFNLPASLLQQENLRFNRFGQEPFLLVSQFNLHQLSVPIQRRLPIYLTKQFRVQVELDSKWFWALTKDVSRSSQVMTAWPLYSAFETLFAAHLASYYAPVSGLAMKLNRILSEALPQPSSDLLTRGPDNVLMYICYPVLEGILKLILRAYVDENGRVLAPFTVGTSNYNASSRPISNLSVYLHALEANSGTLLSKPDLETDLREFRQLVELDFAAAISTISTSGNTADGWDWIYSLRNASLHGVIGWQLRSGLITNLICMLAWHIFEPAEISTATNRVTQRLAAPFAMPYQTDYYPPLGQ